jgi:hypothetical protein
MSAARSRRGGFGLPHAHQRVGTGLARIFAQRIRAKIGVSTSEAAATSAPACSTGLRERGLARAEGVAVVGYDNWIPIAT